MNKNPILTATLTFIPMDKYQIQNVLDKPVLVLFDACYDIRGSKRCSKYTIETMWLRKVGDEYRWYEDSCSDSDSWGFGAVSYFAFAPKRLYYQNGNTCKDMEVVYD
jgi:hypothetical protein